MKAVLFRPLAWIARCLIRLAPDPLDQQLFWLWTRGASRLFRDQTIGVRLASGGRLRVNTFETTHAYIWLFGVWEPAITAYCRAVLKPGDRVVDIGANIGYYSVLAHGLGGQPRAFEPMPATLEKLRSNFALNGIDPGSITPKGVAAAPASARIFDGPPNNAGRASIVTGRGRGEGYEIELLGVAQIADDLKVARLIKIDIEGAERELLPALAGLASEVQADLLLEVDPLAGPAYASEVGAALALFESIGFNLFAIENAYTLPFYRRATYAFRPIRAADVFSDSDGLTDLILSRRTSLDGAGLTPRV